ncbi:hypothetical protein LT335_00555 [Spiroplasma sp. JKS002669]|uniref:hypothetical protein n=1 Tax=Spiroplasma attinicola TaxID=2904537 RepID=UPI0020BED994|nr:hypothetical protein [Spiroplasma sp. JKS002669]MCL6428994.1 hypothetical protein [Spiroplasma sp. JKS002669]
MSYYEAMTILISICSFGTTTFFAYLVYKLTKQANEIAVESLKLQEKILVSQVDNVHKSITKEYSPENHDITNEFDQSNEKNESNLNSYNNSMNKIKASEYKNWKINNNKLKKNFLIQK